MSKYCGECTYLDLSTGDIYGKFYCEKKWERHLATDIECGSFCRAYSRDSGTIENAYRYSNDHTSSGCYLTTILCNILGMDDNNLYLETMRNFRKNILQNNQKYKYILVQYDIIVPKIAQCLNNDPLKEKIAQNYFNKYIVPITKLINENQHEMAINIYMYMTNQLNSLYNLNNISISTEEINNADIKESGHGIYKTKKLIPNE